MANNSEIPSLQEGQQSQNDSNRGGNKKKSNFKSNKRNNRNSKPKIKGDIEELGFNIYIIGGTY